jgi:hypothetical protein
MAYESPENYELLVAAIAMIDAATQALIEIGNDQSYEWDSALTGLRNEMNRARLACIGGAFDVESLISNEAKNDQ